MTKLILTYTAQFCIGFVIGTVLFSQCARAESCNTAVDTETQTISTDIPKVLQRPDTILLVVQGTPDHFRVIGALHAHDYKIVPRQRQVVVTKQLVTCNQNLLNPNRISLLAGHGSQGGLRQRREDAPDNVEVESRVGFVGGAQYQRLLTEKLSIGVQVQTSQTGLAIIGLDF